MRVRFIKATENRDIGKTYQKTSIQLSSSHQPVYHISNTSLSTVYHQTGRKHSQLIAEQKVGEGGSHLGGSLRFAEDTLLVLWVQCEQKVLEDRCDRRVDKMMARGMIKELEDFHAVSCFQYVMERDGEVRWREA